MSEEITEINGRDMKVITAKVYIKLIETEPDKTVYDYITADIYISDWEIIGSSEINFVSTGNGEWYASFDVKKETLLINCDFEINESDIEIKRYSTSGKYYY